jgi:hypothetical protein
MRWFWKHLLRLKDPIDKALFFNSTYISTENGEDTPFGMLVGFRGQL